MPEMWLQWAAALICAAVGVSAVVLRRQGVATWSFCIGMLLLGAERLLDIGLHGLGGEAAGTEKISFLCKSLIPSTWLFFSLVYARGNRHEFLRRWRWTLAASALVPVVLVSGVLGSPWLLKTAESGVQLELLLPGKLWAGTMVLISLGVLVNLEKTFRAAVGMTRWRIKYLFLGVGLVFSVRLYALSQNLLFSTYEASLFEVYAVSLILGGVLIGIGHFRSGFGELDLYPSRTIIQGSFTIVIAGSYFLVVGVLAQIVGYLGGVANLQAQAFLILIGLIGISILFLSDRFRSWLQRFVSRHFQRPEHDFRKLWADFTRRTSNVLEERELGKQAVSVVSEDFKVLGVSVLRYSIDDQVLTLLHSTDAESNSGVSIGISPDQVCELKEHDGPLNLETQSDELGKLLRRACPRQFDHGGDRIAVPLIAADRLIGLLLLSDRVNGIDYTQEELDLLQCIGDQFAGGLLNCELSEEVLQAKELEAFQTLSTFFVHDLKNAANSLNLTLQNLPVHFDDPEFRQDAIHAVERSADRINKMILNLSSLRKETPLTLKGVRLDQLVQEVVRDLKPEFNEKCLLQCSIDQVGEMSLDPQSIRSVVVNLITNAKESIKDEGEVRVSLREVGRDALLVIEDTGEGMSGEFIRRDLFRPFQSTKTKGLGIGMFQCKKVVEAHQGSLGVESQVGRGSRFEVRLSLGGIRKNLSSIT